VTFENVGNLLSEKMNISIDLCSAKGGSSEEVREFLATEGQRGLLIANHPWGRVDIPVLFSLTKRNDVLLVASRRTFATFAPALDPDAQSHIVTVKDRKLLVRIQEHLSRNGLVIVFPTAGNEVHGEFLFASLFRTILERFLHPDDTIATCRIDPEVVGSMRSGLVRRDVEIAATTAIGIPSNRLREHKVVGIQACLTHAGEWHTKLEDLEESLTGDRRHDRDTKNRALTSFFLSQFNIPVS
jgi:hypothetical protein